MKERVNLVWKGTSLCLRKTSRVLATIIPDPDYPKLWRIQMPDGSISDMVNLTRAKDAAIWNVLGILNKPASCSCASGGKSDKHPYDPHNRPRVLGW